MNPTTPLKPLRPLLTTLFLVLIVGKLLALPPQQTRTGSALRSAYALIDSLMGSNDSLTGVYHRTDSLYKAAIKDNAELNDRLAAMENERKSLEANNTEVTDENLQLSQSNRILIIFNSVVAVLLVITLVFVIRRAGRKTVPQPASTQTTSSTSASSSLNQRFSSFEDKLTQLEKLGALKERGILSEEEFLAEKRRILGN